MLSVQKMVKLMVLVFLAVSVVLPAIVRGHFVGQPFQVKGCVYCDTCRCGYETDATEYIPGATVRIECRDKNSNQITYTKEGVTDSTGHYNILVETDRGDDTCDIVLVKSPTAECSSPNLGRERARVILTRNNGIISNIRHANAMGFLKNTPLASCPQILQKYQETDE